MSNNRRPFKSDEKEDAWEKGNTIPGKDSDLYREDKVGNVLYKHSYGKDTPMGWDVDHSKPLAQGGTYHPNNLQPLHAGQNRYDKNSSYPYDYDTTAYGKTRYDMIDTNVDKRSSSVRNDSVQFNYNGTVDKRSSAVRSGDVLLTKSGQIDGRSAAVKRGDVKFK